MTHDDCKNGPIRMCVAMDRRGKINKLGISIHVCMRDVVDSIRLSVLSFNSPSVNGITFSGPVGRGGTGDTCVCGPWALENQFYLQHYRVAGYTMGEFQGLEILMMNCLVSAFGFGLFRWGTLLFLTVFLEGWTEVNVSSILWLYISALSGVFRC